MKFFVRGKWIRFDSSIMNQYYGLSDIDEDDFFYLSDSGVMDSNEIIGELVLLEVIWKYSGAEFINFSAVGMYPEYKVCYYFMCGKILFNSNMSKVTKDSALLNFVIQWGLSVDLGMVIHINFLSGFKGFITVSLGYSFLIFKLCRKWGINLFFTEEMVYFKLSMIKKIIWKFINKVLSRVTDGRFSQFSEFLFIILQIDDITSSIEALQL